MESPTQVHGSKPVTYYFVYLDTELYVRWHDRKRTQMFIKLLFIVIVQLVAALFRSGKQLSFIFQGLG